MPSPIPIRDSGDTGLVSYVLVDAMLCVDCIVKKTGVPASRVQCWAGDHRQAGAGRWRRVALLGLHDCQASLSTRL